MEYCKVAYFTMIVIRNNLLWPQSKVLFYMEKPNAESPFFFCDKCIVLMIRQKYKPENIV